MNLNDSNQTSGFREFLESFPVPEFLPAPAVPAFERWVLTNFTARRALHLESDAERLAISDPNNLHAERRWKLFSSQRRQANRDAAAMERAFFEVLNRLGSSSTLIEFKDEPESPEQN